MQKARELKTSFAEKQYAEGPIKEKERVLRLKLTTRSL